MTAAARTIGYGEEAERAPRARRPRALDETNATSSTPESARARDRDPRTRPSPRPASTRPTSRAEMAAANTRRAEVVEGRRGPGPPLHRPAPSRWRPWRGDRTGRLM